MLVYRVCHAIEANYQEVASPWQKPPGEQEVFSINGPGLYLSFFPEMWRRNLNLQAKELGKENFFYTHTLHLEVPDDSLEAIEPYPHPLLGMEYRLPSPDLAIVRGIAGPEWPLPDWVPQPHDENDWDVTACNYKDPFISCGWTPRGVDPKSLWYYPTQEVQKKHFTQYTWRKRMGAFTAFS